MVVAGLPRPVKWLGEHAAMFYTVPLSLCPVNADAGEVQDWDAFPGGSEEHIWAHHSARGAHYVDHKTPVTCGMGGDEALQGRARGGVDLRVAHLPGFCKVTIGSVTETLTHIL